MSADNLFHYRSTVTRVVDGDTVDVDVDLGFHMWLRGERVRLMGIDTPESRTSNKREKILGNKSKDRFCLLYTSDAADE